MVAAAITVMGRIVEISARAAHTAAVAGRIAFDDCIARLCTRTCEDEIESTL